MPAICAACCLAAAWPERGLPRGLQVYQEKLLREGSVPKEQVGAH